MRQDVLSKALRGGRLPEQGSGKLVTGGNRKSGRSWGCSKPPLLRRYTVSKNNIIKLIQPGNVDVAQCGVCSVGPACTRSDATDPTQRNLLSPPKSPPT